MWFPRVLLSSLAVFNPYPEICVICVICGSYSSFFAF